MRFPWDRRETRESQPFTDAVIEALIAQAEGSKPGDPRAIAALETAAGLYARAFAGAKITPESIATSALTPSTMALMGRDLIRRGEALFEILVDRGEIRLAPAGSWDVRGGPRPAEWWYRLDLFGPSGNETHFVPGAAVVHCKYSVDPARPWLGISPLGWAHSTGTLAANLEKRLGEEAGAAVGHLMPIPKDGGDGGEDDPLALLKKDIRTAEGKTLLVETTAEGWGQGKASAPLADWKAMRFGADPPVTLPPLRDGAALAVLDACGVPRALAESADGTAAREAWRRFVMGAVEPLMALVIEELSVKLDTPDLAVDFGSLWAHDLAGRAASFKAMVEAGMPADKAAALSGVTSGDAA